MQWTLGERWDPALPTRQRSRVCKKQLKVSYKETDMTQGTIQEKIIARALKDPSFRQALQNNPRAVLAEQYHVHLPEEVAVHVLEDAPNTFTLLLPAQAEVVLELTDAELLEISGGGGRGGSLTLGDRLCCVSN
jgi:hypothetical protein